jgi:hypothetical protein
VISFILDHYLVTFMNSDVIINHTCFADDSHQYDASVISFILDHYLVTFMNSDVIINHSCFADDLHYKIS